MDRLDIVKLSLLQAYQIKNFIKEIINSIYHLVISKIRDMLLVRSDITI